MESTISVELVKVAIVALGLILADIRLTHSYAMSAIVMGVTFYKFVMKRNYLSPPTSSQTMPNFLLMASIIQIVTPCPITSAIEMGLCVEIFSMFLVCHSWTVLKPYD
ncbi:hypothetical protein WN943_028678 [Citrus x changshan-huyou]